MLAAMCTCSAPPAPHGSRRLALRIGVALAVILAATPPPPADAAGPVQTRFADAQRLFYSGGYDAAAAAMAEPCRGGDAAACELRAAALLFRIKRELGTAPETKRPWAACATCPALLAAFKETNERGRELTRVALLTRPEDEELLFLRSKLALNHVWLELGVLGHKTGWSEYWEARKTLDKLLQKNPAHTRARVSRAWIDYIVDTSMPRGTKWLLGGGNKKRGLTTVHDAAAGQAAFFELAEARFALWDMQVRERKIAEALVTARGLARDFPYNQELHRFIARHGGGAAAAGAPGRR
jgi:hypothetical protein